MSVQRYLAEDAFTYKNFGPVTPDDLVLYADHARIVAEMEAAHAAALLTQDQQHMAALAEATRIIEGLADQQAMPDDWYVEPLKRLRAGGE